MSDEEKEVLKDEELKEVSGGFIPGAPTGLLTEGDIYNLLTECGDRVWALQNKSNLWAAIYTARMYTICQTKLDWINDSLKRLEGQGFSQIDYDYIKSRLTKCKQYVETHLNPRPHIIG